MRSARVRLGPMELVSSGRNAARQPLWVFPGGVRATFAELAEYARRHGWPRPQMVSTETKKGKR